MAVAAPRPAVHGLSGRFSPTVSDAGMILPHDHVRTISLDLHPERPPSPPVLYNTPTTSSHAELASAPQSRRRVSHQTRSPPLSAKTSRSTLRAMGDSANAAARDDALASSPTIQHGMSNTPPKHGAPQYQRRASDASSMLSEDFENWPGFDGHDAFDDSGLGLEDQERRDQFPGDSKKNEDLEGDRWLNQHSSGSDESDDPYSSAALSRRAEIILANAKKRLNVMEGNLRGARESLVVSPTFNSSRSSSEMSLHINTTRERDRRLYAGIGPIPPRMNSFRSSPLSPTGSPSHARGLSETSVPLPFSSSSYLTRNASNKRASSAIGHTSGPWSPEGFGHGRFPIKESRSFEVIRDPRNAPASAEQQYPVRTTSRNSRSPPGLETLQEDEDGDARQVHRSASAASGLRDQMNDLKGRISSLKQRAQEDQLRRRSMQSLRTSSPFTNAQEWYSGSETYNAGGSPIAANAGLGIKTDSLTRQAMFDEHRDRPQTPETNFAPKADNLLNHDTEARNAMGNEHADLGGYIDGQHQDFDDLESYTDEQDFDETDEGDFLSVNGGDEETGPESIYEDAVYEMPATERHEDRVDAFDYEHFFLHSAMGTYSLEGRRSSIGSDSSTATTRPVTAMQIQDDDDVSTAEKRVSYHARNPSSDSVSTVASFATAAENQSDDEEANEQMDQFSEQILAQRQPVASRPVTAASYTSLRSDSAINMRRATGTGPSPTQSTFARGSSSPADLASGLQVSKMFSILTESSSPTHEGPRLALSEEEKQLIYSLASSFQQVSSNLQHTEGDQYERKEWRRRLDAARRVLNGEEVTADDDSF
ncbi:hypothetical protein DE146DRAFT_601818 [Phaeosphaeria sp. MPI-PUGE-AT-0046c]|nr:hypothetical protein DE146DRAFT_601818 [Phaeosphaeria sp. MPI-PUGE-AT-0046c]